MDGSWILKKLYELAHSVDMYQPDPHILLEEMYPHLRELSAQLYVAALHVHLKQTDSSGEDHAEDSIEYNFGEYDPLDPQKVLFHDDQIGHDFVCISIYPVKGRQWTEAERAEVISVVRVIMTEINRACLVKQFNDSACTDLLTGVYNRFGAEYFGNQLLESKDRGDYVGCYIDLKNFKLYNEQYGYSAADAILREYAAELARQTDTEKEIVVRTGCDRFLVLVCAENLSRFLKAIESATVCIRRGQQKVCVPVSAWIGVYPVEPEDKISGVLSRASFAAEQAKKKKHSVMCFNRKQMDSAMREKVIVHMLPTALQNGELEPYYQPKVRLSDGALFGCEALAHWMHDGVNIPPAEFVPYAEQNGIVCGLDLYILECVCRDIREWLDAGLDPVCVSVNYSQQDFYRETLIEDTLRVLEKYRINGRYIEIEITETSFLELPEALSTFIDAMHAHGIKVALDDFGIGYSSLSLFRRLSLDTVKLDKSFVDDLKSVDDKSYLILQSITEMIHRQNAVTVAEGIENSVQLELIRDIGGHVVQGFLFDHPLPKAEFEQRLMHRQHHKTILDACIR